jgi:hypothetical protein
VLKQAGDVVQGGVREVGVVALGLVEEDPPLALAELLVDMHPVAGLAVDRLGHEGREPAVAAGDVFDDVLDHHGLVRGANERGEAYLDLALAGRADLVVVVADRHAHLLQRQDDLAAEIVEVLGGRDAHVARLVGDSAASCRPR